VTRTRPIGDRMPIGRVAPGGKSSRVRRPWSRRFLRYWQDPNCLVRPTVTSSENRGESWVWHLACETLRELQFDSTNPPGGDLESARNCPPPGECAGVKLYDRSTIGLSESLSASHGGAENG
jgi:hypothetical protein